MSKKMICPFCGGAEIFVLSSAPPKRRRCCGGCGYRWNSFEIPESDYRLLKSIVQLVDFSIDADRRRS